LVKSKSKKLNDAKKPVYTGSSLETGIIFSKLVENTMLYSVAVRAKDGEISTTSKKIKNLESTISRFALVQFVKKMLPVAPGANFKMEVMKTLRKNDGKFKGEINLPDKHNPMNSLGRIVSQCFNLMIFALLPLPLTRFLSIQNLHILGIVESFVSPILILVLMLGILRLLSKGNHLARYHGAEHKVIQCFYAGESLTLDNVKKFNRDDVQCGTNLLSTILIASAIIGSLIFSFVAIESTLLRTLIRVLTLPTAYVLISQMFRLGIKYENEICKALLNFVSVPGLWLQRAFSTEEPSDEQLEVAIVGFNALLAMNEDGNS